MKCKICSQNIPAKEYIEHLKTYHPSEYEKFNEEIIIMNNLGTPISEIAEYMNISQSIIKRNLDIVMESETEYKIFKPIDVKVWEPRNFKMEATTVWSFKNRGNWATHNGKYRGNWSPYIPRNLILRYSKEGDVVLDPFVGSGTTLIETKLLKRKGIGIDINPDAVDITKKNLQFNKNNKFEPIIYNADSRDLNMIPDNSIDLICAHPPYANIIKYSNDIEGDLSLLDIDEFLVEIWKVAKELFRVLKKDRYCAILIGDTRRNKHMIPLGFYVMEKFLDVGFVLKESIIKEQHNCKATGFWYQKSIDYNFLLIAHEYLFVFRKP